MSQVSTTKDFWNTKARKFATTVGKIYFYPTILFLFFFVIFECFPGGQELYMFFFLIMAFIGMFFFVCYAYILPLTYLFFIIQSVQYLFDKRHRSVVSKKKTEDIVYFVFYVLFWPLGFLYFLINLYVRGI